MNPAPPVTRTRVPSMARVARKETAIRVPVMVSRAVLSRGSRLRYGACEVERRRLSSAVGFVRGLDPDLVPQHHSDALFVREKPYETTEREDHDDRLDTDEP